MSFGSDVQNKVLDAVGACRACGVSSFTNQVLGLADGRSALVRERTVDAFADAVLDAWRACFAEVRHVIAARE